MQLPKLAMTLCSALKAVRWCQTASPMAQAPSVSSGSTLDCKPAIFSAAIPFQRLAFRDVRHNASRRLIARTRALGHVSWHGQPPRLLIRHHEISISVRTEPVEALRPAQSERFKLQRAGSIGCPVFLLALPWSVQLLAACKRRPATQRQPPCENAFAAGRWPAAILLAQWAALKRRAQTAATPYKGTE